jgi:hypothetical protein
VEGRSQQGGKEPRCKKGVGQGVVKGAAGQCGGKRVTAVLEGGKDGRHFFTLQKKGVSTWHTK